MLICTRALLGNQHETQFQRTQYYVSLPLLSSYHLTNNPAPFLHSTNLPLVSTPRLSHFSQCPTHKKSMLNTPHHLIAHMHGGRSVKASEQNNLSLPSMLFAPHAFDPVCPVQFPTSTSAGVEAKGWCTLSHAYKGIQKGDKQEIPAHIFTPTWKTGGNEASGCSH